MRPPDPPGRPRAGVATATGDPAARGVGIIGAAFGLAFFLGFLLLAVQILYSLHATSVLTHAGYDAARRLARTGDVAEATARFEAVVGSERAAISFEARGGTGFTDADTIVVHVRRHAPGLLPAGLTGILPFQQVERTLVVRNERFVE